MVERAFSHVIDIIARRVFHSKVYVDKENKYIVTF